MSKPTRAERRRGANASDGTKRRKILLPAGWKRDFWAKNAVLRPAVRAGLILRSSGDGLVVSDPETGKEFQLKELNCRVCVHSNGIRTAAQIAETLKAEMRARRPLTDEALHWSFVKLIELGILVLRRYQGTGPRDVPPAENPLPSAD